jgi:hypothetical protein
MYPEANMEQVVTTIFFNGQFWVALIERIGADGTLEVGKHTFGPEPGQPELIHFYQNIYPFIPLYHSDARVRIKARRKLAEQERCTSKSLLIYKEQHKAALDLKKKDRKQRRQREEEERYRLKCEKRKKKRRGH